MQLSLQNGGTPLIRASEAGHMECVQVLLDKGAIVDMQSMVSGVIIHCVHAMQYVPRVPSMKTCAQEPYCVHTYTSHVV